MIGKEASPSQWDHASKRVGQQVADDRGDRQSVRMALQAVVGSGGWDLFCCRSNAFRRAGRKSERSRHHQQARRHAQTVGTSTKILPPHAKCGTVRPEHRQTMRQEHACRGGKVTSKAHSKCNATTDQSVDASDKRRPRSSNAQASISHSSACLNTDTEPPPWLAFTVTVYV